MYLSCLISIVQADADDVMLRVVFSWYMLEPWKPINDSLNTSTFLGIVSHHMFQYMTMVKQSSSFHFQLDNAPGHT